MNYYLMFTVAYIARVTYVYYLNQGICFIYADCWYSIQVIYPVYEKMTLRFHWPCLANCPRDSYAAV